MWYIVIPVVLVAIGAMVYHFSKVHRLKEDLQMQRYELETLQDAYADLQTEKADMFETLDGTKLDLEKEIGYAHVSLEMAVRELMRCEKELEQAIAKEGTNA